MLSLRDETAMRARRSAAAERGMAPAPAPGAVRRADERPIAFLVRCLCVGGAERQLVTLARGLHERGRRVLVFAFYPDPAPLEDELRRAGVPVHVMRRRGRWDLRFLWRLARLLRAEQPAVLHGYLGVPNLIASAMRGVVPDAKVIWGQRASDMRDADDDWAGRLVEWIARTHARRADAVFVNSRAGLELLADGGCPRERLVLIPNGVDVERFVPDRARGRRLRAEWGVGAGERVVGIVGRLDPMKDHPTFLAAAARLLATRDRLRFVCVGGGDPAYRAELQALAHSLGVESRVRWEPARADVESVYNALDVLCSSSAYGEGFSNVVGEAMACGVPCVVTDVGDSAWLVADPALVAPKRDPEALAARLAALLDADDDALARAGRAARARIVANFSVPRLIETTERAIDALTAGGPRAR